MLNCLWVPVPQVVNIVIQSARGPDAQMLVGSASCAQMVVGSHAQYCPKLLLCCQHIVLKCSEQTE